MTLFVPEIDTDRVYEAIRDTLILNSFDVIERHIYIIEYEHDNVLYFGQVGQKLLLDNKVQIVRAIFELASGSFAICTNIRGIEVGGNFALPILTGNSGNDKVLSVVNF